MLLDREISLKILRDDVEKFVQERQWGKYHVPKDLSMASLDRSAE